MADDDAIDVMEEEEEEEMEEEPAPRMRSTIASTVSGSEKKQKVRERRRQILQFSRWPFLESFWVSGGESGTRSSYCVEIATCRSALVT